MTFQQLSTYFESLEHVSSRLRITDILVEMLQNLDASEVAEAVYLSLGGLAPAFDRKEFGLADKSVLKALAHSVNRDAQALTLAYKQQGDLGELAQSLIHTSSEDLTILEVYKRLVAIADTSGIGSQDSKRQQLSELLSKSGPVESKYIVRIVLGKLRLGFSDMTYLDAFSFILAGDKSLRTALEAAYQLYPDVAQLALRLKAQGLEGIQHTSVTLGVPVVPALAERLKTADEMIDKMGEVALEAKYDGTRVQIHFKRQGWSTPIRSFTRNLDESSHMFPELLSLGDAIVADEVILDSEGVGFNPESGELLPFQATIQRKRKHAIADTAAKIPLKFFIFDLLYKDGQSLISLPFYQRRQLLIEILKPHPNFELSQIQHTKDPEVVRSFHQRQLAMGLEGAILKKWQGPYRPGRRGHNWVKFKESEGSAAKLSDTIDAVVMGLYLGKGKRQKFGVGAFLVGVLEGDKVVSLAKVGTGLTDDQWRELHRLALPHHQHTPPVIYKVEASLTPDIWLAPEVIVEIAGDELTESPLHTSGWSVRFPRLVRFRQDKNLASATTLRELRKIQ